MPSKISCPRCQNALLVPDKLAGKSLRCPQCKETIVVPQLAQSQTEAPAARNAEPNRNPPAAAKNFGCPNCQNPMTFDPSLVGQTVGCPHCSFEFKMGTNGAVHSTPLAQAAVPVPHNPATSTNFACPNCRNPMAFDSSLIGQAVVCPHCSVQFIMGAGGALPFTPQVQYAAAVPTHVPTSGPPAGQFRCPYCSTTAFPMTRSKISTGGWVVFVVLLLFCFPLFWIGLLMKEQYRECSRCGMKIGG